ncbi:DUF2087 domain-containing protein [Brachybacterium sp. NPDC056505]|uniref:DUF2087 domain-containing protein n=1 Tax=Brachybacterium sp. NPDC056505 TaxID=3345843 RepID=UPI00366AF6D9
MTRSSDFKKLVRARMERTGENFTAARAALLAQAATRPERIAAPTPDPAAARAHHEKLIRPFLIGGVLERIPAKRTTRLSVLLELLARFAPGEVYTEADVGDILRPVHEDVAYLRRELVDYGYLERDGVGAYWLPAAPPARVGNMAQEVSDWEAVWLPRFLSGTLEDETGSSSESAEPTRPAEPAEPAEPAGPADPTISA